MAINCLKVCCRSQIVSKEKKTTTCPPPTHLHRPVYYKSMLPKTNRLKKKKDFERVFKEGKGFKEDFLIFKFVKNNLNQIRFGIIVSQKISKKATIRNKIKRRIRELIRRHLPAARPGRNATHPPPIKEGFDIVLVALPGLETKDFWEIEETINKLLKKAKLI